MKFQFYLDAWHYMRFHKMHGFAIVKRAFKEWEIVVVNKEPS